MTIPAAVLRSLLARERDDPILYLLTITHADLPAPLRWVTNSNGKNVVSNGLTFTAAPFAVTWPDESAEMPSAQLTAVNVDRAAGLALDSLSGACGAKLEAVLASDPDTVWRTADNFELRGVKWNSIFVSGSITREPIHTEPVPWAAITPKYFAALFR